MAKNRNKLANLNGVKVNPISSGSKTPVKGGNVSSVGGLSPYTPVKFEVPAYAKYWIPSFDTAEGDKDGKDSLNEYVSKIDLDYVKYIPRTQGFVLGFPFGLTNSAKALTVWANFKRALEEGYIAQIVNNINAHFATRAWAEDAGADIKYYSVADGFVKSEVEKLITTTAFPSRRDETVTVIVNWLFDPEKVVNSGYIEADRRSAFNQSSIKQKVEKRYQNDGLGMWYDVSGISSAVIYNKLLSEITDYFKEYFAVPNSNIKADTLAALSKQKSYLEVVAENYKKATGEDKTNDFVQGHLESYTSASNNRSPANVGSDSDWDNKNGSSEKTDSVVFVALAIVLLLLFLKRRKK